MRHQEITINNGNQCSWRQQQQKASFDAMVRGLWRWLAHLLNCASTFWMIFINLLHGTAATTSTTTMNTKVRTPNRNLNYRRDNDRDFDMEKMILICVAATAAAAASTNHNIFLPLKYCWKIQTQQWIWRKRRRRTKSWLFVALKHKDMTLDSLQLIVYIYLRHILWFGVAHTVW